MSNFDPNYDDTDDDEGDGDVSTSSGEPGIVRMKRADIRALERKAAMAESATRLQRENVLLKLGVDTESVGGKLLLDQEQLPWDKPDSIKEIAMGINAMRSTTETTTPETTAPAIGEGEQRQGQERSNLAAGATSDTGVPEPDPYDTAIERRKAIIAGGGRDLDGLAGAVASIREAGQKGDQRVIHSHSNPHQHYPPSSREVG